MTFTGFTGSNLPALLDDFNRADNVLLTAGGPAAWREGADDGGTGLQVASNQIASGAAGLQVAYYSGISDNHIGFAFTIATMTAGDYDVCGAIVTPDGGNGFNPIEFYFTTGGTKIEVWYDNGTLKNTMTLGVTFVSGDQIGFDCEDTGADNVYKVFRRAGAAGSWSQVGTYTDAGSGRGGPWDPGFGMGSTSPRFDDFYAEAITVAAALDPGRMNARHIGPAAVGVGRW